jgi:hypothetical protein
VLWTGGAALSRLGGYADILKGDDVSNRLWTRGGGGQALEERFGLSSWYRRPTGQPLRGRSALLLLLLGCVRLTVFHGV